MEILRLGPVGLSKVKKVVKMTKVMIYGSGCMLGRIE